MPVDHDHATRVNAHRPGSAHVRRIGVGYVNGLIKSAVFFFIIEDVSTLRRALIAFLQLLSFRISAERNPINIHHLSIFHQVEFGPGFDDQNQIGLFVAKSGEWHEDQ
nr:hypothetical protein [Desulfatitalea tepidiphila]